MTADLEEYIRIKLESGEFATREQLTETAIEFYRDLEQYAELRHEVQRRLESANCGDVAPLDISAVKSRLLEKYAPERQPN
jgi:hypothetical protein